MQPEAPTHISRSDYQNWQVARFGQKAYDDGRRLHEKRKKMKKVTMQDAVTGEKRDFKEEVANIKRKRKQVVTASRSSFLMDNWDPDSIDWTAL